MIYFMYGSRVLVILLCIAIGVMLWREWKSREKSDLNDLFARSCIIGVFAAMAIYALFTALDLWPTP